MTIAEYQEEAARTCPDLGSIDLNILHMELGIATEIGELLDIFKKHIAYKKELDIIHIGEEIADCCWYIVNRARILNNPLFENITNEDFLKYTVSYSSIIHGICDTLLNIYLYSGNTSRLLSVLFGISVCYGLDFYKILENNINKLKIRYPDKFTEENALNRDLDKERTELEK